MTTISTKKGFDGAFADLRLDLELPALTGSEKQIAWATSIRLATIKTALTRLVNTPAAARLLVERKPEVDAILSIIRANITLHADSRWWIDNRGSYLALMRNS